MKIETLFLKIAVVLIGIPILVLCILGVPWLINNPANPNYAHLLYPILICMYVSVIPFFIALYQALRLLSYIDKNKAFTESSVKALKNIKFCAFTISILYAAAMPFIFGVADKDDAPGLVLFGLVFVFAPVVIAIFAAVLQMLLRNAIDIKKDNDLTI
jgi:hypothetical protein